MIHFIPRFIVSTLGIFAILTLSSTSFADNPTVDAKKEIEQSLKKVLSENADLSYIDRVNTLRMTADQVANKLKFQNDSDLKLFRREVRAIVLKYANMDPCDLEDSGTVQTPPQQKNLAKIALQNTEIKKLEKLKQEVFEIKDLSEVKKFLAKAKQLDPKTGEDLERAWTENLEKKVRTNYHEIAKNYPKIGDGSIKAVFILNADGSPGAPNKPGIALLVPRDPSAKTSSDLRHEVQSLTELESAEVPTIHVFGGKGPKQGIFQVGDSVHHVGALTEYVPGTMRLEAKSSLNGITDLDRYILLSSLMGQHKLINEASGVRVKQDLEKLKTDLKTRMMRNPDFKAKFIEKAKILLKDINQVHQFSVKEHKVISDLQILLKSNIEPGQPAALVHDPLAIVSEKEFQATSPSEQRFLVSTVRWVEEIQTFLQDQIKTAGR